MVRPTVIFFIYLCIYFISVSFNVPPTQHSVRSESLVKVLHFEPSSMLELLLTYLCLCLIMLIILDIDPNCRYVPFNAPLNTLCVSTKANKNGNICFLLLFLSYLLIFDYYFIVFLPCDFWRSHLHTRRIRKKLGALVRAFHSIIASTITGVCNRTNHLCYVNLVCFCHYPMETSAIWIFLMHAVLCPDIHPNPGPPQSNHFAGGFLSFCNWNLNTLSKDDFTRITLLEAHNTEHNYDIISLCETSLDDTVQVPEMTGYKFHS